MSVSIVDSYSETNRDSDANIYASFIPGIGQSFTCSTSIPLYSAKFYLNKSGSPTGNVFFKIYNISGTSGTSAIPTGSALATSDAINIASLSTSYALIEALFTGVNIITLGVQNYVVTCEYTGGDSSNYLNVGVDNSSPTDDGNQSIFLFSSWTTAAGSDTPFYVYGGTSVTTTSRTQTGISRITANVTKTQSGKSRITSITSKTQPGKARVTAKTSKTQSGTSRITAKATKTQTGKAYISVQRNRTQVGRAKIIIPSTDTFTKPSLHTIDRDDVISRVSYEDSVNRGIGSNL